MNIKFQMPYQDLCRALAALRTPEEVALFLEDLCTIQEAIALSQRFQVANLLTQGMNYVEISGQTGVSSATISRVSRCLNYGPGGYAAALEQIKGDRNDNQ